MEHKKYFSKLGLILLSASLIIYAVQIISLKLFSLIPAVEESTTLSTLATMLPMYIIAFPIIFWIFGKVPVQVTLEQKKMSAGKLFLAFMICYSGTYICNFIGVMLTGIIGLFKQSEVDNVMLDLTGSLHPAATFFIVVVCAPIMEELLFRKALMSRTAQYGEGISILLSGFIFGLFHGNLNQFMYAFLLGIFFGFIYMKTGNIRYTIILHMGINFMGSFIGSIILEASRYFDFVTEFTEISTNGTASETALMVLMTEYAGGLVILFAYFFLIIGLVITGLVLFFVNLKKFKVAPGTIILERGKRFSTVILNVGMILYSIFWIVQIILQLIG